MALSDPQSVTISAVATDLAAIGSSLNEGRYQSSDGEILLTVKHGSGRRNRHIVELQKRDIVSDPLVPAVNQAVSYTARLTVDMPNQGVTAADAVALADALVLWATSANNAKVVGGQV